MTLFMLLYIVSCNGSDTLCDITFISVIAEVFQNNTILVQHVLLWLLGNQIDLASWYIVFDYID